MSKVNGWCLSVLQFPGQGVYCLSVERGFPVLRINICVGSSCFIRGARDVVRAFEDYVDKHNLTANIELTGSFCIDNCNHGVTVTIGDRVFTRVHKDEVNDLMAGCINAEHASALKEKP